MRLLQLHTLPAFCLPAVALAFWMAGRVLVWLVRSGMCMQLRVGLFHSIAWLCFDLAKNAVFLYFKGSSNLFTQLIGYYLN